MGIINKAVFIFIILLLIPIFGCTPKSAAVAFPTAVINATGSPTNVVLTKVPPSPPPNTDSIHLRIEFQTSSDWSDLNFLNPETILEVNLSSDEGDLSEYKITPERVSISQVQANAENGNLVGITFDLHLDPEALTYPQFLLLERGELNSSRLKIYYVHNDEPILLQEIIHTRMVLDQLGRNPHTFTLDLSSIHDQLDE